MIVQTNKVGRIKQENVDFNKNFEILGIKLRNIRNNLSKNEKLNYEIDPNQKFSSLSKNKEIINKSNDSSDVNLDDITDSILSITRKNSLNEKSITKSKCLNVDLHTNFSSMFCI